MKGTSEIERQKKLVEFAEQLQAAYAKLLKIHNPNSKDTTDIGDEFIRSPAVAFNTFENALEAINQHFESGQQETPKNYFANIADVKKTLTDIKKSATEIKNLVPKNAQQPLDKIFVFIQRIFTMFTKTMGNAQKLNNKIQPLPKIDSKKATGKRPGSRTI